ncbi:unnamed protein product [Acanthosepion pharaonis]|uniref:Uncharacterized protein n=1 Tax=Acanthosepion pharaonis TaxID=158019 RepID=A0A812BVC6_ACAPH|nr:unnamed protein product [Sepia pharaonis]
MRPLFYSSLTATYLRVLVCDIFPSRSKAGVCTSFFWYILIFFRVILIIIIIIIIIIIVVVVVVVVIIVIIIVFSLYFYSHFPFFLLSHSSFSYLFSSLPSFLIPPYFHLFSFLHFHNFFSIFLLSILLPFSCIFFNFSSFLLIFSLSLSLSFSLSLSLSQMRLSISFLRSCLEQDVAPLFISKRIFHSKVRPKENFSTLSPYLSIYLSIYLFFSISLFLSLTISLSLLSFSLSLSLFLSHRRDLANHSPSLSLLP